MAVENNIPEGWLMTFLGDITNYIRRGITPKYCENESIFVINQRCIRDNKVSLLNARFHDLSLKDVGDEKRLKSGDILICSTGVGTLGRVAQYKLNDTLATVDSHVTIVRPNDNIFKPFLGLLLSGKEREIEFLAEGTTGQTELPRTSLGLLQINLPPLPEQKAIAKVLTAFDDKIELLQAQNKTLEIMAQTIFKEWFGKYQIGDELPEGWRLCELGDIVSKSNTGADAIKKAPIVSEDTGVRCLRIGDLSNNRSFDDWGFTSVTEKNFKQFQLKKYDIVITRTSILGLNKLIMKDLNAVYNNGLIKISLVENVNPFFIFSYFKSKRYRNYISMINNDTSTRPNMKIDYLLRFPIILPTRDLEVKFSKFMGSAMLKISKNKNQIQSLTKTRDTLLPKLMSGQVRVKNIKQTTDA